MRRAAVKPKASSPSFFRLMRWTSAYAFASSKAPALLLLFFTEKNLNPPPPLRRASTLQAWLRSSHRMTGQMSSLLFRVVGGPEKAKANPESPCSLRKRRCASAQASASSPCSKEFYSTSVLGAGIRFPPLFPFLPSNDGPLIFT